MQYKDYLKTQDWKDKRTTKRNRHKRCSICSITENLDVHHLNYRNLYGVQQTDLRVLCRRCHFLAHRLHKEGKFKFNGTSHHSRFTLIKTAVKKELGLTGQNLFNPKVVS